MAQGRGRGGEQRIPRPADARPGAPPPWAGLAPEQRRIPLAVVRARLAALPPPIAPDAAFVSPDSREAAVLLALFEADGEAQLVLTKRPDTMPSHQGEIAFPGGKRDPGDPSLEAAALREACEEVGLPPDSVEVVAELDSLGTVASQFTIAPFVGLLAAPPVLRPDPVEVVAAFAVPLSELLDPAAYHEERWHLFGDWRSMAFFHLPGETVWGATARILTRFLAHVTADLP
jgi:8-oxo-dGTP pyrophosphatase MutT (NUDIX family)